VYGVREDGERAGERALLGFAAVQVGAGETRAVTVQGSLRPVSTWDPSRRDVVASPGALRVEVAGYSGDPAATATQVVLH
jgi:beta-glucosidase